MASKHLAALNQLYTQPDASAQAIGLSYVRDGQPGYTRRKAGKGWVYLDSDRKRVTDPELKQRFDKLVIPPAWKQVWICPAANGHLQATGIDDAGRKQYQYHPDWQTFRNRLKFYHLIPFTNCLPRLRRQALQSIRACPPASADNVLAAMVLLLDKGALRIGNEVYYELNESVGLTTLLPEHVEIEGSSIRLSYTGKHGQAQNIGLNHRELAAVLTTLRAQGGPRLFCYRSGDDSFCNVSADTVNQYLQAYSPCPISAKDFRTWKGTLMAYEQMLWAARQEEPPPLKQIIEAVAQALGNTPAVAQSSYIHPDLLTIWKEGTFANYQRKVANYKAGSYFSKTEHQLQKMLELLFRHYMQPELEEVA